MGFKGSRRFAILGYWLL